MIFLNGCSNRNCEVKGKIFMDNLPAKQFKMEFHFNNEKRELIKKKVITSENGKFSFKLLMGQYFLTGILFPPFDSQVKKSYSISNYVFLKSLKIDNYNFNTNIFNMTNIYFVKKINMIYPLKKTIDGLNVVFKWSRYPNAKQYHFRVMRILTNSNPNAEYMEKPTLHGYAEFIKKTNIIYNELIKIKKNGKRQALPLTTGKYVWQLQAINSNGDVISYSSDGINEEVFYVK